MAFIQAVAIGLTALILTPGLLFYFDVTPKLVVVLAAAGLLLPFALRPARVPRTIGGIALLYLFSLVLSSALGTNPSLSWFGTNWRRYGAVAQIAIVLLAATVTAAASRRAVLRAIALATALACVYGMAQFAGIDPWLPAAAYHIGEGEWTIVRPPATFGYVSYFATWLAMAAFLAVALARLEKQDVWRRVALAAGALAATVTLLTGSRASMLGLAAGAAIWLFRRGWRIPRRALAYAALLPIAVAAFYFSPAGRPLRSRTRWFIEDPWGGARPTLWRDSLAMGLSRPLLGFGPEVFTAEFPRYQSEALARAYPDFAHESPHNIFLDALVSQGLPGVILLALLLLAGLRTRDPAIAAALTAGIVSQQFTVFTIPTALLTFTTVALALPCFETKPGGDRRIVLALVPVSLALLYCAARYSLADYELARAQSFLQAGDTGSAAAAYGRYTGWRLPGASADLWYSRTLLDLSGSSAAPSLRLQAMTLAGGAALQATTSAEDPFNAWYHAAQLAAARNDVAAAELALRYAIAASPTWFKPHWTLARLLALTGRREEARREAALALRLDAGKHPEVGISLANALGGTPFQK